MMFLNKIFDTVTLQCELCQTVTSKHNVYVCESGHTICVNCDDNLNVTSKKESQKDSLSEMNFMNVVDGEENIENNLAGGDYITRKSLSKKLIDENTETGTKKHIAKEEDKRDYVKKNFRYITPMEATIVYKNLTYDKDESIKSLPHNILKTYETEKVNVRPIICPVLQCRRTVAFNSILKHFSFDHSDIPILPVNFRKTLKIYLKPINLSRDTKCVAIINPIGNKSVLLLMVAKIFQTNCTNREDKQSGNQFRTNLSQNKYGDADLTKTEIEELHEDIIIWICRLTEFKQVCCVKVKRDNILGYSYIGEGLDIQSQSQDPFSAFKSPECLILRYHSIPKLLDDQGQIHVYINLLK